MIKNYIPFLSLQPQVVIARLSKLFSVKLYDTGDEIISEGSTAKDVFWLISGVR